MSKYSHGVLNFKVAGKLYVFKGNFKIIYGGFLNEPIEGQNGPGGFSKKWTPPSIETSIIIDGDKNVKDLLTAEDIEIVAERANGKATVLQKCTYAGKSEFDATTGEFDGLFVSMDDSPAQDV